MRTQLQNAGCTFCTRCMISTESNWENILANGGHSVHIRRSYDIALGVSLISWRTKLQHVGSVFCTRCMISTESNWKNILAKYMTLTSIIDNIILKNIPSADRGNYPAPLEAFRRDLPTSEEGTGTILLVFQFLTEDCFHSCEGITPRRLNRVERKRSVPPSKARPSTN